MRLSTIKSGAVAAVAAIALAACSGQGSVPSAGSSGVSPDRVSASAIHHPMTATACNSITGLWEFQGSCVETTVKPTGRTFKLTYYRGLIVTVAIFKNDATAPVPFIFGDAIGDGDITGTVSGNPFPAYGFIPCVSASTEKPVACTGTAFVYLEAINASTSTTVTFNGTPRITVVNSGSYPGATCTLNILDKGSDGPFWLITPIQAAANGGFLQFKSAPITTPIAPGPFYIGLTCA